MEMTFGDYINNPLGRKNMVYSNRQVYATLYKEKLDKILVREVGKIKYSLYHDSKKGTFFCYLKIPSEPIANFYYDVVIQFYTNDKEIANSKNLKKYFVKFYSNDPAFVYTFAHAMAKNDLFITDLKSRMSKIALKKIATERNPKDEVGYVKSIYFAYLTMLRYGLFDKMQYTLYGQAYNPKLLIKQIEDADIKVRLRQEAGEELNKKKRIEKQKERVAINNTNRFTSREIKTPQTKVNHDNNRIRTTQTTKRTNVVKRTKKI